MKKNFLFFVLFLIGAVYANTVFAFVDKEPLSSEKCVTPEMIDSIWSAIRLREAIQNNQGHTAEISEELEFLRSRFNEFSARFSKQVRCQDSNSVQSPALPEKTEHVATETRQSFFAFWGNKHVNSFGAGVISAVVAFSFFFLPKKLSRVIGFVQRKLKEVSDQQEARRVRQALQVFEYQDEMRKFVREKCIMPYTCAMQIPRWEVDLELATMRPKTARAV